MQALTSMISGFGTMMVFSTLLLIFLTVYVVLRWRGLKDEDPDPQLGIKATINFLQFVLLIFALLGFSLIFTALFAKIGKSGGKDLWKLGIGMLWGAGVLFAGFEVYYRKFTNGVEFQEVRRSFMGLTLVIMGLIAVFSFLLFWMGLFDKWTGLSFNFPFGLWLIFVPATGGGMILFQKMFFPLPAAAPGGYPPAGGMPPGGGGGGAYEQPAAAPQPMPEQPMAQEAPAPQPQPQQQPGMPAPQPGYPQPGGPAPAPYPQPGAPAPQPGLPNPGYPSAGTPAPQSPGLPGPSGGYGGGGGFGQ